MPKMLLVDPEKCTGCHRCEMWCTMNKEGVMNPSKARLSVLRREPAMDVPVVCLQCGICVQACAYGALSRDMRTGAVVVDEKTCVGCGKCVMACPYGMIVLGTDRAAKKCDLCGGHPVCVAHCPENAITYVDAEYVARVKRERYAKGIVPDYHGGAAMNLNLKKLK